ncbi:MAG: hypothetical protein IPN69_16420 [Acidobacteria bacterium]|nr:hypothetical protein [Acidobacteriota bacterium]MBK8812296.1 hypothetical protein [Acidobacteriota bacterium]
MGKLAPAESLETDDLLRNIAGEWKPIIAIERVFESRATFNFEVEGNHNYFVGLGGWLVHNDCTAGGSYVVYQGLNRVTGAVEYVGITSRNLGVRVAEHRRVAEKAGLQFLEVAGASNLTKIQARVWEQKLINQHGLANLQNKINSIGEKYWSIYGIK